MDHDAAPHDADLDDGAAPPDDVPVDADAVDADTAVLPDAEEVLALLEDVVALHGHGRVATTVRACLEVAREQVLAGAGAPDAAEVADDVTRVIAEVAGGRLVRVINATGVVLHTNLGRAPLSAAARRAVVAAVGYTDLEFDLATGARGSRATRLGELIVALTHAEDATVVNNGAAALVLVLAANAAGREVVVSRRELATIGGPYRLAELMRAAGVVVVEVGTREATTRADYAAALGPATAAVLKVQRSATEAAGLTDDADLGALADLAHAHGVPLVHDLGTGLLRPVAIGPLAGEPSVAASLAAGVDVVVVSGDKVLGGPQSGLIVGRATLVEASRKHPLARALRIDKMQRAALEATLAAHEHAVLPLEVPTVAMLGVEEDALADRARWMAAQVGAPAEARAVEGSVGGGALPGVVLASWAVALIVDDAEAVSTRLRQGEVPVIARIADGVVLIDLRTVPPDQDAELVDLVLAALD